MSPGDTFCVRTLLKPMIYNCLCIACPLPRRLHRWGWPVRDRCPAAGPTGLHEGPGHGTLNPRQEKCVQRLSCAANLDQGLLLIDITSRTLWLNKITALHCDILAHIISWSAYASANTDGCTHCLFCHPLGDGAWSVDKDTTVKAVKPLLVYWTKTEEWLVLYYGFITYALCLLMWL